MHGRFDQSDQTTVKGIIRSWGIGIVVLPVLLVAFLVGLAITKPDVSRWISEAAQAEFVSSGQAIGSIPAQVGQPARQVRAVKAY
ncbi:MAG: hypothetical protein ACXWKP_31575 [Bradyrhizobium sp.]